MHRPLALTIQLPERLSKLLSQDARLDGAVKIAVAGFSEWLSDNKTVFFPDYTDHGVAHVSNVLASADAIIAEDSWDELTPEDAAAIIAAALLHDCAMHLSIDGFSRLLGEAKSKSGKLHSDELTWAEEYQRFIQESARWDRERLMAVFGDDEPVVDPQHDLKNVSDKQKLLIGEFVRRHHARMAHEFALDGVPGAGGRVFHPFRDSDVETRDLYGFIARSHNLSIRSAVDKLPDLSRPVWMQIHVPFVMAVLRIADYIQIDSKRASRLVLQLRSLRSPISRLEWAKHHAIQDLHNYGNDPEALTVNASPPNVAVFAGLRRLFADVQRELDEVWAVLGEIYGRLGRLTRLGIRIRRLRSSLDDLTAFEDQFKPPYVPREVRLTTASAELLHLLVVPLYGARPSIGIRELLQNSLDACNERASFVVRHGGAGGYTPAITVSFEPAGDFYDVSVRDNGCGMTLQTIEDFFLKAGASFRRSQWWKSEFMTEDGHSTVRRTGRFGVGVLAAFLLGERVSVKTRHFLDESGYGYEFSLSLNNSLIELRRERMEVGTQVSIEVHSRAEVEEILWPRDHPAMNQWYLLDEPSVEFIVPEQLLESPSVVSPGDECWNVVPCEGFERVAWSYSPKVKVGGSEYASPRRYLACNGIFIGHTGHSVTPDLSISENWSAFRVGHPTLVVEDRDGRLPLNIQRSGIAASEYPFHAEFLRSIAERFAGELVAALRLPIDPSLMTESAVSVREISRLYGERYYYDRGVPTIGLSQSGWFIFDEPLVRDIDLSTLVVEMTAPGIELVSARASMGDLERFVLLPAAYDGLGIGNCKHFFRGAFEGGFLVDVGRFAVGGVIFLHTSMDAAISSQPKIPKFILEQMEQEVIDTEWRTFSFGQDVEQELIEKVTGWLKGSDARAIAILKTERLSEHQPVETALASAWLQHAGSPVIAAPVDRVVLQPAS